MNPRAKRANLGPIRAACCAVWVAAAFLPATAADETTAELRQRALVLYDARSYSAALEIYQQLDVGGEAAGADLYRLYFCQRSTGDIQSARTTLGRALGRLEEEFESAPQLEVAFYLANAYRNVARLSDMRRVGEQSVRYVENGDWPEPTSGRDMFVLGKLYADLERSAEAARWYNAALETRGGDDRTDGGEAYVEWASRYLAETAFENGDYDSASRHFQTLLADRSGSFEDHDRLAISLARTTQYEAAAIAWGKTIIADPGRGDRPRYSGRLAFAASKMEELPVNAPDGRPWNELTRAELEAVLLEQAEIVRSARIEVQDTDGMKKRRWNALVKQVGLARPVFVAAGLEYALQGHPIRETAFSSGYAPLIFRDSEWKVPYRK